MKKILSLPATLTLLALSLPNVGCATLFSGSGEDIQIASTPTAATVKVERSAGGASMATVWAGTTPAIVNLKRKHTYVVTVSHEGYEPVELGIQRSTNGWVFANLVFFPLGTLLTAGIDYGTGAAYKLKPNEILVNLVRSSITESDDQAEVNSGGESGDLSPLEEPPEVASPARRVPPPQPTPLAPQFSVPQPSRKGFLIGLGAGPGRTSYTYGVETPGGQFVSDREGRTGLMTDFKLGYAPSDRFQLYWMSKVSWFSDADVFLLHGIGGMGAIYALRPTAPSLYLNAGVGFSTWQAPLEENSDLLRGLGLSGGIGYEVSKNWIVNLDLTWGRPSNEELSTNATAVRFTVGYLHY